MRDTGSVDANGFAGSLSGKLRKGTAHTVVRIDVSAVVELNVPMSRLLIWRHGNDFTLSFSAQIVKKK